MSDRANRMFKSFLECAPSAHTQRIFEEQGKLRKASADLNEETAGNKL